MVTIEQNAHKVVYLATLYPDQPMPIIFSMFQMPAIDINSAMWFAVDKGWLIDNGNDKAPTIQAPSEWNFGEDVEAMQEKILIGLKHVAKVENDIEEGFLMQWCQGYPSHVLHIAVKDLVAQGKLGTYSIDDLEEDGNKSTYTFYCLPENTDKRWGEKQFKDAKKIKEATEPQSALDELPELPEQPAPPVKTEPTKH